MYRAHFLRKLRKYVAALPALAFGFIASPAFSTVVTIDASGVTVGAGTASFVGATMTTSPGGTFTKSTTPGVNSSTVIGVSGGYVSNEIDVSGDKIRLHFGATGAVVNEITIGLLYRDGAAGDVINEAAWLQTNGGTACASGATAFCILSSFGVWRGGSLNVQTVSPATAGNGGIFRITNPFPLFAGSAQGELINSIDFMAWAINGSGSANSDFGLVSVSYTTTAIPEPGTLMLVGFGLLGLTVAGGRRARA